MAQQLTEAVAPDGFRHEALLYRGTDGFVEEVTAFVRDSLAASDPVLVAVGRERTEQLRAALDADLHGRGDDVLFADMAELGRNPARIIPAWRDFLISHGAGRRVRGVGEPVWPERTSAELLETQRHEVLLSIAFTDLDNFWLVCPYDLDALAPEVIQEAYRSHAWISEGGVSAASDDHVPVSAVPAHLDHPLDAPPAHAPRRTFATGDLSDVRHEIDRWAAGQGMPAPRADLLVLAVNELTTNSVEHGGGRGELLLWRSGDSAVAEVRDGGYIAEPLIGRLRPDREQGGGRGIWLVNHVCDLVELRSSPAGTVARVHLRLSEGTRIPDGGAG
ncbi:MAG: anti-sigma factor RsbA family regulatory protein [Actinomycetes bacterium]